jgi:outer membrane protein
MKLIVKPLSLAVALLAASSLASADTLRDIYELALKNDAKLKSAEATYRATLEVENQALSAMLPQISASAGYMDQDIDTDGFSQTTLTNTQSNRQSTTETWGATLDQKLFDLSAWYGFKSGQETSKQAEAQLAADQQDLIIRTAKAYFDVLRALENLEASKAEERATKRQLEQTQQRFDVGLIAITDVHEAQAVYDDTVVQRLTFEGNVGTSYEALTVLTGSEHANLWLLNKDYPIVDPNPMSRSDWVDFALQNNYSLKAALYAAESARQNASAKKMEHAPKLSGRISYDDDDTEGDFTNLNSGTSFPIDQANDGPTWSINLSVPIYSGGRISAQRRQAYEQYNAARQQQIDAQRTIVQNTRSLHLTVTTDVQRVKARARGIVSTQSALEATQAGYEVGTRNIVDVLQAQRALYGSIRDYANARYDYVLNMLRLKQQAGTLSPQDILDLNQWLISPSAVSAKQYSLN